MSYISKQKILLPKKHIDYSRWSVIACDQFTSQLDYWKQLEEYVGDEPSTLNLIFPEAYLNKIDSEEKVNSINKKMITYLGNDIFDSYEKFIYVEREIAPGVIRKGIVLAIDLESYDYSPTAKTPIRATELTVKERLPIRIKIRKDAALEIPHVCIFMDDRDDYIMQKLESNKNKMEKLYDFNLNMNGGHIVGYLIDNTDEIQKDIDSLLNKETLKSKYNSEEELLFVIGDGNHSLATAKECWNMLKEHLTEEEKINHPARYALCELQNIHDKSINFEPIHRILFGADDGFLNYLKSNISGNGTVNYIYKGQKGSIAVSTDPTMAIAQIQQCIDDYMKCHSNIEIDYIHGDNHLEKLVKETEGLGIYMPKVEKMSLFDYVSHNGVMPRKSFSIGHAESKRYYLESHQVR